jgi:hypothetical protein
MAWNRIFESCCIKNGYSMTYTDTKKQHDTIEITPSGGECWNIFLARIVLQRHKQGMKTV